MLKISDWIPAFAGMTRKFFTKKFQLFLISKLWLEWAIFLISKIIFFVDFFDKDNFVFGLNNLKIQVDFSTFYIRSE